MPGRVGADGSGWAPTPQYHRQMRGESRPTLIALFGLGVFAVAFVSAGLLGWWAPAPYEQAVGEVSRWCERVSGGLLRERVNTLGNLGFIVAGLAMFTILGRDTRRRRPRGNRLIGNQPIALLYAAATVFLGPGSMVMHGSHTFFGAWIDNVSMVAYITIPWLLNIALHRVWSNGAFFGAYASIVVAFAAGYWFFGPDLGIGLNLFGVSIGLWIISEVLFRFWSPTMRAVSGFVGFGVAAVFGITPIMMLEQPSEFWWVILFWLPGALARSSPGARRRYTPWFWAGAGSFLVGYSIWLTGTDTHPWCRPDSLIQAHAIWHLLTALATWCFFKFLRTENPQTPASSSSPKRLTQSR